jgi:hypothetical protein
MTDNGSQNNDSAQENRVVTIEQIKLAEVRTRGFIAHDQIVELLKITLWKKENKVKWFSLPESTREILEWVGCGS